MTLLYCTVSSAINQKTTTFITHHDGERWATEVIRTMNSSDTQISTQLARQFHHIHTICLVLLQKGTLTSLKPDLLEAASGKETVPSPNLK